MEPTWPKDFPRLYELYRESEQDNEANYFKDFDSILTIPPDRSPARSSFERLEKETEELDEAAWQAFKQKVRRYKSYITKKHELRGYQQLFDLLNEVNGYLYLKSNGCEEIQFISEKNVTTPDLIACCGSFVVIMEVKTINESKKELDWIIENSKRPYDRLQVRKVRQGLDDSLKRKISDTVSKAKSQLLGYAAEKVDRRIVYLAIRLDILTAKNSRNIDELAAYIQQQSDNQIEVVHTLL
jgi:Holliday junction resolvase-like predicted endonuclease